MEQPATEFDVDPVGGVAERVSAQKLQQRVEQPDEQHPDDDHRQRRVALVDQRLVDDQLKEDRRQKGKRLDKQRGDQNFGQRLAIPRNRWQKPAKTKRRRIDAGSGEAAGDENDRSARQRRRLGERQRRARVRASGSISRTEPLAGAAARMANPPAASADQRRVGRRVEAAARVFPSATAPSVLSRLAARIRSSGPAAWALSASSWRNWAGSAATR